MTECSNLFWRNERFVLPALLLSLVFVAAYYIWDRVYYKNFTANFHEEMMKKTDLPKKLQSCTDQTKRLLIKSRLLWTRWSMSRNTETAVTTGPKVELPTKK